jgi:Protein of unknown function (DUF3105)
VAKKKSKRRGPGRAGAGTATAPGAGPSAVKPQPATPGGPNRLERKEAARQARERLRRKTVRRRTYRRLAIGLAVAAVVGVIVYFAVRPEGAALTAEQSALLEQAPQAATTAGCSDVQTIGEYDPASQDRAHIGGPEVPNPPPLSTYPSTPPVSGPHNPTPLGAGVYADAPDVYQTIHSLEHAAVVVWVSPEAASDSQQADELARLQEFFRQSNEQTKVIVAPYNYADQGEAGQLPAGKNMALVAWHHLQACDKISLPVAFDFVAHYRFPTPKGLEYRGDAPEPAAAIG